jgi:hypothetical protein
VDDTSPLLPLNDLSARHPGLTEPLAAAFHEAARVCLDRHHASPSEFSLSNDGATSSARVEWEATDEHCRRAWANETDTTEAGAYACGLAATELVTGLVAVGRAETRTGADFYLNYSENGAHDLEEAFRLEISGVDRGSDRDVETRLLQKLDQARRGASNLPAMAAVIGFKAQRVAIRTVEDTE